MGQKPWKVLWETNRTGNNAVVSVGREAAAALIKLPRGYLSFSDSTETCTIKHFSTLALLNYPFTVIIVLDIYFSQTVTERCIKLHPEQRQCSAGSQEKMSLMGSIRTEHWQACLTAV